jgi:outer membrane protein TolC
VNSQVAANVERNYFELLIAQRQQKAAEAKVNTSQSAMQIATTGTTQLSAITERQIAFLEASKNLATISSQVTELTHSLNLLIGFEPDTELELLEPEPATDNVSQQDATQQAQATSLEIVEAEQTVVKAKAAATLSKLDYVPDVAVIGGYAYERVIPILPRDFSFIGFMASLTLFDFGKRENTVSARNTEVALAKSNVDLVKAKVAANARKAYLDLQRTRKIRDLTRQIVSNYQTTLISYPKSAQETDAARAQAEAEMFQAELDYRLACYELKRVMDGH